MNKLVKAIPLFLVAFSIMAICLAEGPGIGISDYEAHPQVRIGENAEPFKIAKIDNVGTFNLTITPFFKPNYNETDAQLQLIFTPNSTFLLPEGSTIFYGQVVSASKVGTFEGMIQFKTQVHLPENFTGNPSTPGGSAKITVMILEPSPPTPSGFIMPFPIEYLLVPILAIPSSIGAIFFVKRHRHPSSVTMPKLVKQKGQPNDKHVRKELMKLSKMLNESKDAEASDDTLTK